MYDVITIGAATQDVFLRSKAIEVEPRTAHPKNLEQTLPLGAKIPVDDCTFTTGGGATNAAVTFARMGELRTACVCEIGKHDPSGAAVLVDLRTNGVRTELVQHDSKLPTAYSVVIVSGSGERTILVYRGASQRLIASHVPWGKMRASWYYVTSLGGDLALMARILAHAEATSAHVAWNPGSGEIAHGWAKVAPLAACCAVFNVNKEEAMELAAESTDDTAGILRKLSATNYPPATLHYTILTDGPRGAYVADGMALWHIASRDLRVTNTTGAGDAFGSAFVLGLMRAARGHEGLRARGHIDTALRLAMANAEGVITHMGPKAGILARIPGRAALAKYRVQRVFG